MKHLFVSLVVLFCLQSRADTNGVMMQYFHWYSEGGGRHWSELAAKAPELAKAGVTALWLPPPTKGMSGASDVGYGLYDLWDLGEFDQKGSVATKYGTKSEYLGAIRAAKSVGIDVYSDIILNHLGGGDALEAVRVVSVEQENRSREVGSDFEIEAWTRFDHPQRRGKYSSFTWRWYHFDGTDWDQRRRTSGLYKFRGDGKNWDWDVDQEKWSFDYLLFNDTDLEHPDVRQEFKSWGNWLVGQTGLDGFRIDAAKHTQFEFVLEWIESLEQTQKRSFFSVGEYWSGDLGKLRHYVNRTKGKVALFDFILQDRLASAAAQRGFFDLSTLFRGTWVEADPIRAVTFVDNHDTQRHPRRFSPVDDWFKPLAYTLLLLRRDGYPCLFYPDYYGASYVGTSNDGSPQAKVYPSLRSFLDLLLSVRRDFAYGRQHDYFDDRDVIGWTREGKNGRAIAIVISDSFGSGDRTKRMFVGQRGSSPRQFKDVTGHFGTKVTVGPDGHGIFPVREASDSALGQSVSIWVEE